tara:strand:+ start:462 stop:614 length:153 start_codon:yes stop_codon:yes gene_type:complete
MQLRLKVNKLLLLEIILMLVDFTLQHQVKGLDHLEKTQSQWGKLLFLRAD